jgi:hypothetical protein
VYFIYAHGKYTLEELGGYGPPSGRSEAKIKACMHYKQDAI